MTRYRYQGPPSSVSLRKGASIRLVQGGKVDLDPAHPYTLALLRQGHLTLKPEAPPTVPAPAATKAVSSVAVTTSKGAKA